MSTRATPADRTATAPAGGDAGSGPARCLKIAIDARSLRLQRTGVERMAYHFIDSLREAGGAHTYFLFVDRPLPSDRWSAPPYREVVEPVRHPTLQRFFDAWITLQLPGLIRRHGIDLFFSPHTKFPLSPVPRFTTVHGLEWRAQPQAHGLVERVKQWSWLRLSARYSTGIVTFAWHTLGCLQAMEPHVKAPICVVPEGVDGAFRVLPPAQRSVEALAALGVRTPYVLSVCSQDPRKNLDGLIRAFACVVRKHGAGHQLVLAGRGGPKSRELADLSVRLGLADRVRMPGYVRDEDLVQLYNQSALFVYPSRYEGFGLPVLEAMACGVPVVTSRGGSLAEVAGDAAILVNPDSDEDLAAAILRGLSDDSERSRLRAAGLLRASQFSWPEMTRRICEFMIHRVPAHAGMAPGPGRVPEAPGGQQTAHGG